MQWATSACSRPSGRWARAESPAPARSASATPAPRRAVRAGAQVRPHPAGTLRQVADRGTARRRPERQVPFGHRAARPVGHAPHPGAQRGLWRRAARRVHLRLHPALGGCLAPFRPRSAAYRHRAGARRGGRHRHQLRRHAARFRACRTSGAGPPQRGNHPRRRAQQPRRTGGRRAARRSLQRAARGLAQPRGDIAPNNR